ncbi:MULTISPECIES: hypothetical protein [unclassified Leeuwenhoekiella]|uniref:hypothetical protein n=1 Tax=unclassified Leeuwenhoekiella TaxID=2615029 RepID=UPI000C41F533|nr:MULTISPECIES: hypothetical protein [unclassified Leeuwenhoekiella]MAW94734.1 hypothetical protein [Leeuwenhoekiella sp.]MAW95509.1 hypothetical protein [Leeuwenhoekiella sp.]MBA82157.1 hypothetical protein [Leeuwenhoekiella sp.]|tara:strand:+ start:1258 stop:1809 length:552 start_codon:yes stop_codon:yes gene_type:complete
MTEEAWVNEILKISARLADRKRAGQQICNQPQLLKYSLSFIKTSSNSELTTKSAYAVDQALREDIELLKNYKPLFFQTLVTVTGDTEKRIFAKILELVSQSYIKKHFPLSEQELQLMISTCFDWLMTNEKVAVKVFAMQCIYNLKETQPWIVSELKAQLENQFQNASQAFQSRARHILKKLKN